MLITIHILDVRVCTVYKYQFWQSRLFCHTICCDHYVAPAAHAVAAAATAARLSLPPIPPPPSVSFLDLLPLLLYNTYTLADTEKSDIAVYILRIRIYVYSTNNYARNYVMLYSYNSIPIVEGSISLALSFPFLLTNSRFV